MIFEKINTVPTSEELLNKSFRRASRAMSGKTITGRRTSLEANESMMLTAANILTDNLKNIVRRFPTFENLPPFYYELADVMVGVDDMRKSLSKLDWASAKIHEIAREYVGKVRKTNDPLPVRKQCFGRISSIVYSIDKDLLFLNEARNKLRKLPAVSDEPTIVVAGYPNIGKSSFVTKVTGATPEIAPYPFTTKGVSIGHFFVDNDRYQVLDTPGLLDRPMSERNEIELQAITALKNLDAVVMFIIDASETCGYEIKDQKRMLEEVQREFKLPVLVVANKADLPEFKELDFVDMKMSTVTGEGISEVTSTLIGMVQKAIKEKETSKQNEIVADDQ